MVAACIRKDHRGGIARTRFQAEVKSAAGQTDQQYDIRLFRKQSWHVAIDGGVRGRKHVRAAHKGGQSRSAPAGKRFYQSRARIGRRTGEGAETGKEHAHDA